MRPRRHVAAGVAVRHLLLGLLLRLARLLLRLLAGSLDAGLLPLAQLLGGDSLAPVGVAEYARGKR